MMMTDDRAETMTMPAPAGATVRITIEITPE